MHAFIFFLLHYISLIDSRQLAFSSSEALSSSLIHGDIPHCWIFTPLLLLGAIALIASWEEHRHILTCRKRHICRRDRWLTRDGSCVIPFRRLMAHLCHRNHRHEGGEEEGRLSTKKKEPLERRSSVYTRRQLCDSFSWVDASLCCHEGGEKTDSNCGNKEHEEKKKQKKKEDMHMLWGLCLWKNFLS